MSATKPAPTCFAPTRAWVSACGRRVPGGVDGRTTTFSWRELAATAAGRPGRSWTAWRAGGCRRRRGCAIGPRGGRDWRGRGVVESPLSGRASRRTRDERDSAPDEGRARVCSGAAMSVMRRISAATRPSLPVLDETWAGRSSRRRTDDHLQRMNGRSARWTSRHGSFASTGNDSRPCLPWLQRDRPTRPGPLNSRTTALGQRSGDSAKLEHAAARPVGAGPDVRRVRGVEPAVEVAPGKHVDEPSASAARSARARRRRSLEQDGALELGGAPRTPRRGVRRRTALPDRWQRGRTSAIGMRIALEPNASGGTAGRSISSERLRFQKSRSDTAGRKLPGVEQHSRT